MKAKKHVWKSFSAIVMALTLSLGMMTTAFAAQNSEGTEASPATAKITKVLNVAEGTSAPAADFKFAFTAEEGSDAPAINDAVISYTNADEYTVENAGKLEKTSQNVLQSVNFTHAGIYTYTVKETANTYSITDSTKETMTYSQAEYEMKVYVENNTEGTGVFVKYVTVEKKKNDDGSNVTEGTVKVDPNTPDGDGKGFVFNNTYVKVSTGTPDPVDPVNETAALTIGKEVAGNLGDKTKDFSFSLSLTKASTLNDEQTYHYYIAEKNGEDWTKLSAYETANKKITTAAATTFTLKHNQKLVIVDAHAGTKYTVTETGTTYYVPSAKYVENGGAETTSGIKNAGESLALTTKLIGENTNTVAYTNTYSDTNTPTGIIINNLPFILLILIAALGMFCYVAARRRRA